MTNQDSKAGLTVSGSMATQCDSTIANATNHIIKTTQIAPPQLGSNEAVGLCCSYASEIVQVNGSKALTINSVFEASQKDTHCTVVAQNMQRTGNKVIFKTGSAVLHIQNQPSVGTNSSTAHGGEPYPSMGSVDSDGSGYGIGIYG